MDSELVKLAPIWILGITVSLASATIAFKRLDGWKAIVLPSACIGLLIGPCILNLPFISGPTVWPAGLIWPMVIVDIVFQGSSIAHIPKGVLIPPLLLTGLSAGAFFLLNKARKPTTGCSPISSRADAA